jgi:hypothetical protein
VGSLAEESMFHNISDFMILFVSQREELGRTSD